MFRELDALIKILPESSNQINLIELFYEQYLEKSNNLIKEDFESIQDNLKRTIDGLGFIIEFLKDPQFANDQVVKALASKIRGFHREFQIYKSELCDAFDGGSC